MLRCLRKESFIGGTKGGPREKRHVFHKTLKERTPFPLIGIRGKGGVANTFTCLLKKKEGIDVYYSHLPKGGGRPAKGGNIGYISALVEGGRGRKKIPKVIYRSVRGMEPIYSERKGEGKGVFFKYRRTRRKERGGILLVERMSIQHRKQRERRENTQHLLT